MTPSKRESAISSRNARNDSALAPYVVVNCIFLSIFLIGIGLLASLEVTSAGMVRIPWLDRELPSSCWILNQTGKPCPSCGLTRSTIMAVHGEFARSRAFHPAGVPLFLMAIVQCAMRIAFLRPKLRQPVLDVVISSGMLIASAILINNR